jgi:hypothetical protein
MWNTIGVPMKIVADIFQMPSAELLVTMEVAKRVWLRHMECACYFEGRCMSILKIVAGIFQMPSAELLVTMEVASRFGYGTWNVPATLWGDSGAL